MTNPIPDLQSWLAIATDGLAAEGKERVRWEIEAHYAEAVEEQIRTGVDEATAREVALDELGSPKAAKERFTRVHFTETENDWLDQVSKPVSDRLRELKVTSIILHLLGFSVFLVVVVFSNAGDLSLVWMWGFYAWLWGFYACLEIPPRFYFARAPLKNALVFYAATVLLGMFTLFLGFILFFRSIGFWEDRTMGLLFVGILFLAWEKASQPIRMLRKIKRNQHNLRPSE
jgi:hypothetical protein